MASGHAENPGNSALVTAEDVTKDLLNKHAGTGDNFWRVASIFGILLILGIVGFIMRLSDGFSDRAVWGYYAAMFAFILTTAQSAPMVAIAPRLAKAHWRRPISRIAELWTVVGLFNLLLFIPMLWVLPSLGDGRRSLWFYFDGGDVNSHSPHIWATLAILALVVIGIALLWMSALPDFAQVRDHAADGWKKRWATKLARGWIGTSAQWNMQKHRLGILGAFYFMMLIFVHFLVSMDFLMTLVPGWIDALYPVTHAANGLQAGVATVMLTMWALYKFGGYEDYIGHDQIWALGKLLFALSLLWFWFWFSSFNIYWYGQKPEELAVIKLLISGPYRYVFFAVFFFNFLLPMWTMMWNPLRRSTWGPPLIAASVLIGTFLDRIRLYVAAYSVPGIGEPSVDKHIGLEIDKLPDTVFPDLWNVFIMVGAIGGMVFIFMMATRVIPIINIWEQRELKLYEVHKKFYKTVVRVLGKPD
jgi:molybdopterin-containing oxidoreductase family membrane subunit